MKTWLLTQEDIIGLDQEKNSFWDSREQQPDDVFAEDIPKHNVDFFRDNKAWHFMWIACLSIFVF